MFCGDCILELLRQKNGSSIRGELKQCLLERGYGTEAIRQAYIRLEQSGKITLIGSR